MVIMVVEKEVAHWWWTSSALAQRVGGLEVALQTKKRSLACHDEDKVMQPFLDEDKESSVEVPRISILLPTVRPEHRYRGRR
jgi:hypothetical protein